MINKSASTATAVTGGSATSLLDSKSILSSASSPLQLSKKVTLQNRFVLAPMTRAKSHQSGAPNIANAKYYEKFSDFGMIVTEGTLISKSRVEIRGDYSIPTAVGEDSIAGWKNVVDTVKKKNPKTVMCMQLWDRGCQAPHSPEGPQTVPWGPAEKYYQQEQQKKQQQLVVKQMEKKEMQETISSFAEAARSAVAAGFDSVQIHGAHGYSIWSWLAPHINTRSDEYGGSDSVKNRLRFPVEVCKAIRAAIGEDVVLQIRLSDWAVPADHLNMSYSDKVISRSPEEFEEILNVLCDEGTVDVFDISTRRVLDPGFPEAHPTRTLAGWANFLLNDQKENRAEKKRGGKRIPVIGVGSVALARQFAVGVENNSGTFEVVDPTSQIELIAKGEIDMLGIGRGALADEKIVSKLLQEGGEGWKKLTPYSLEKLSEYP